MPRGERFEAATAKALQALAKEAQATQQALAKIRQGAGGGAGGGGGGAQGGARAAGAAGGGGGGIAAAATKATAIVAAVLAATEVLKAVLSEIEKILPTARGLSLALGSVETTVRGIAQAEGVAAQAEQVFGGIVAAGGKVDEAEIKRFAAALTQLNAAIEGQVKQVARTAARNAALGAGASQFGQGVSALAGSQGPAGGP